jgi:hypothetical protein
LCLYTEEEAAAQFLFVCFWVGFFSGPYFELHFPVFIFSYSSQNS